MSRISIFGDAVTVAKGDYNCCNDQRPANPCFPGGFAQEGGFAQTSKNTPNAFRSTSLTADRTAFRYVQTGVRPRVRNLRAVDDTCDGLKKNSHTLVFQSTAAVPPFCRAASTPAYLCVADGEAK